MNVHVDFSMFLDRPKVLARVKKKNRRVLFRTGGATRIAMKRSMRKRKKPKPDFRERIEKGTYRPGDSGGSQPGEPPRYHSKHIRDEIFFGYDQKEQSIVTGPLKHSSPYSVTVPELLNEGGTVAVTLPGGEKERATYLPRPFATLDSPAGQVGQKVLIESTEEIPF